LGVQHEGGGGKESLLKGEDGESTLHIYIWRHHNESLQTLFGKG
jgi:hypothetical protein